MTYVQEPEGPCPKCGQRDPYTDPEYHASGWPGDYRGGHSIKQHLDWQCHRCGHHVETPTADAEPLDT